MTITERFPDTLFLPDRARLAINCLNGGLNPDDGYLPYCLVDLTGDPPTMAHTQFDWSDHTSRVIDALLLAGAMTGDDRAHAHLEPLVALFERGFGADGLHYTPDNRWTARHANMHYQRSVLNALLSLSLTGASADAAARAAALVRGLRDVSIQREGYAYFPAVERLPDGWPRGDWGILGFGVDPANTNGRLIAGLTRVAELLDAPEALDLAGDYARHVMHYSSAFGADGSFATGMEFREGHFHSRALTMLGVIRYGRAAGDAQAVEWGRRVFDRACAYGTSFGWFPERLVKSRAHGCETCAIVDMIEAAMALARAGHPRYWEHAERFLRNQLVESQLTRIDWIPPSTSMATGSAWETTEDVARRSLGGFAGWSQPNDLVSKVMHRWDLYMCCCAQGVRGLFNAWTQAVVRERGRVRVNLLLNHRSALATVRSWMPADGRVEVVPARACDLELRVPEWVDRRTLRVTVRGQPVEVEPADEAFVRVRGVDANALVAMRFPLREQRTRETVLGIEYTLDWRGDTVVGIDPRGSLVPLYEGRDALAPELPAVAKSFAEPAFAL